MEPYLLILCANLKGNLGDYAILEAMMRLLRSQHPGHEVRFYSHGNKSVDPVRMPAFEHDLDFPFKNLGRSPFQRRPRWLRMFRRQFDALGIGCALHDRAIEKLATRLACDKAFVKQLSGAKAVFFAGGAQWGRGDLNLNMFAQLNLAAKFNRKVFCFPFSISGEVIQCNGVEAFRRRFEALSSPIPVRDVVTHQSLLAAGIQSELYCDCVFSLSESAYFDVETDPELRDSVFISLTGSGGLEAQQLSQFIAKVQELGLKPALLSTCEIEDRELYESARSLRNVPVVYPKTWREAVACLRESKLVFTNRLHCMIFSALAKAPVVPVTNRTKSLGYYQDADLPMAINNVSEVSQEKILLAIQRSSLAKERQASYLQKCTVQLKQLFDRFS